MLRGEVVDWYVFLLAWPDNPQAPVSSRVMVKCWQDTAIEHKAARRRLGVCLSFFRVSPVMAGVILCKPPTKECLVASPARQNGVLSFDVRGPYPHLFTGTRGEGKSMHDQVPMKTARERNAKQPSWKHRSALNKEHLQEV
jgi:hypothetical protein